MQIQNKNERNNNSSTFTSILTLMKNYCISSVGPLPLLSVKPAHLFLFLVQYPNQYHFLPPRPPPPPKKKYISSFSVSKIYWPMGNAS